jgi:hypothetical protein
MPFIFIAIFLIILLHLIIYDNNIFKWISITYIIFTAIGLQILYQHKNNTSTKYGCIE